MILLWTRDCSLVHLSIHPLIFRSIDLFVNADRIIDCIKQKLRNINLSREDFFIILVIFAEKLRDLQFIRTFFHALTAINTVLNLFHVFLPGL